MRRALAALVAVAAMAAHVSSAHADGFVSIVPEAGVTAPKNPSLDLASLKPDVHGVTYSAVATPGGTPQPVTVSDGYSLHALLVAAGVKPSSFGSAEIVAPSGPPIVMSYTQATSQAAYNDGSAVIWDAGSGAQILVPSTPTGNTNAGETFPGPGGTVTIDLYSGQPLSIGISAIPQPAIVNKPVTLRASVFGAPAGAISYQWSLGDNITSALPSPTQVYTRIGTYQVYLQATSAESPGASTILSVVVGKPPVIPPGIPAGSGPSTYGTGGGGSGPGSGSGQGTGSALARSAAVAHPHKRAAIRHLRPRPPTGPVVTGILISDPQQVAAQARSAAGAARSARYAKRQAALAEWMYILIAVLVMLVLGALLEWNSPRAWFAVPTTS